MVQAIDEVVLWELMDVFLEGKVDRCVFEVDGRAFVYGAYIFVGHAFDEILLDVWVAKVKEMAGKVPDKAILFDGFAVATDFGVAFEDDVVIVFDKIGKGQATDACADDQVLCCLHRFLIR
jgi:hypothetical protein